MINSILIFIGSVIGAGFASGQEIQLFFKCSSDLLSVLVSVVLFTLCPLKIYLDTYRLGISDYGEYLRVKTGVFSGYFRIISILFSISSYCIMVCGINTVFENIGINYAGIVFALLCFFMFFKELKALEIVNAVSTPVIIAGILLTAGKNLPVFNIAGTKGIYYASYNILSCLPVLVSFNTYFKSKKQAMLSALVSGGLTGLLIYLIYLVIPGTQVEMPMLYAAENAGMTSFYTAVLILAMLTTSASSGMCFIKSAPFRPLHSNLTLAAISILTIPFGFSEMVEKLFGFFGIASAVFLLFILAPVKNK